MARAEVQDTVVVPSGFAGDNFLNHIKSGQGTHNDLLSVHFFAGNANVAVFGHEHRIPSLFGQSAWLEISEKYRDSS